MNLQTLGTVLILAAIPAAYIAGTRSAPAPPALIKEEIVKDVLRAVKEGTGGTVEKPLIVNVKVPEAAGPGKPQPVEVKVVLQPSQPATPTQPAQQPRVIVQAPEVYCRTEEECRRIMAASPQSITVSNAIKVGTPVAVCLQDLDASGACPLGQEVIRPLSQPYSFRVDLVLSERGVFHQVLPVGSPLVPTAATQTSTTIEPAARPRLPYNLGLVGRVSTWGAQFGIRYVNRLGPGYYEIEPLLRYDYSGRAGFDASVAFVYPIR